MMHSMTERNPIHPGWTSAAGAGRGGTGRVVLWAGLASLLVTPGLAGCAARTTDDTVRRIDALALARRLDGDRDGRILLIDSRPADAHREGRLPGSVNIRLNEVSDTRRDPALERYRSLIVYGQNAGSAAAVAMAKRFIAVGYSDVQLFDGGFDAWVASGLPVTREVAGPMESEMIQPRER